MMLRQPILSALLALPLVTGAGEMPSSDGKATLDPKPHREALCEALKAKTTQYPISAQLSVMGANQQVRVTKADETGVDVEGQGNMRLRWKDLSDSDLIRLAITAHSKDAEVLLHAGTLGLATGDTGVFEKMVATLWEVDPNKAKELERARPPAPKKEPKKEPPPPDPAQKSEPKPDPDAQNPRLAPADILFSIPLDTAPEGPYSHEAWKKDWPTVTWNNGLENRVSIVGGKDAFAGRSLRVLYPKDGVGPEEGGAQWNLKLRESYPEVYCSYMVRFAPGFDFVKGGKLPGLAGGKANTGGRKPDGNDGWSARIMWRPDGKAVQYVYHADQQTIYGDDLVWKLDGKPVVFVPGTWHHVETRVVMNTPGKKDGIIQSWFDGKPALDRQDLRFRNIDTFAIDLFYFSTFFGGAGKDWAASKDEYVYYDNFMITRKRAGPPRR
jgi:hypothetical protein